MTALAGELTVRQLGEMLRERGMRLDGLWWSRRLGGWAVDVSGIDALIVASDLQDALMLAVSRIDEVRRG